MRGVPIEMEAVVGPPEWEVELTRTIRREVFSTVSRIRGRPALREMEPEATRTSPIRSVMLALLPD